MSKRNSKRPKGDFLRRQVLKQQALERFASLDNNELARKLRRTGDELLSSPEWKALRRKVIATQGSRCACCGRTPRNPQHVNVDHIKPRKYFPELALVESNLQVLCGRCNKRKGNLDTDYRSAWDGPVYQGDFSDYNVSQILARL